MAREYTPEDILIRAQNFRVYFDGINFRIPNKSCLEFNTFKNECVAAYAEIKKYSDPEASTPSRARIERIAHDKRKLGRNTGAFIGKPESFPGTVAMWKFRIRNNYRVDGQSVMVKSGKSWEELTPFEECFALFAECHTKGDVHNGRDATYRAISAEGTRTGLPKNFVMNLIDCYDLCKQRPPVSRKRGREVDGDGGRGSAKRKLEPQPQSPLAPGPPAPGLIAPAAFDQAPFVPAQFGPVPDVLVPDIPIPHVKVPHIEAPYVQVPHVQAPSARLPISPPISAPLRPPPPPIPLFLLPSRQPLQLAPHPLPRHLLFSLACLSLKSAWFRGSIIF